MHRRFLLAIMLCVSIMLGAWIPFDGSPQPIAPSVNVVSGNRQGFTAEIIFHGMYVSDTTVNGITYDIISIPDCGNLSDIGKPSLPFYSLLAGIAPQKKIFVSLKNVETITFSGYYVFPAQHALYDSGNPYPSFVIDTTAYGSNVYYPEIIAQATRPAIFRDVRVASVHFTPFSFNPYLHSMIAVHKALLDVRFSDMDSCNTTLAWPDRVSPLYASMYEKLLLNYSTLGIPGDDFEKAKYLIITDAIFEDELEEFVFWKRKKGIEVFVETINDLQRDTLYIKNLISTYYNTYNIDYVLLVGDALEPDQPGYISQPLLPVPYGMEKENYPFDYARSDV